MSDLKRAADPVAVLEHPQSECERAVKTGYEMGRLLGEVFSADLVKAGMVGALLGGILWASTPGSNSKVSPLHRYCAECGASGPPGELPLDHRTSCSQRPKP